ncbi:MAG: hypothetical protein SOZ17_06090 [Agathobacter sp.]|nr:hypothetical protein [Agathobacter sp.]
MSALIPFLVIVIILLKVAKKNQEQTRKSMQSRTPQEPVNRPINNPVNHPVMPSVNQETRTVDRTGSGSVMMTEKKAETKKAETKHLNNVNPIQERLVKEKADDILVRANRNTDKYAEDDLHEPDCELHGDSESILGEIQDLMICGYSGNMEFERDFLGEATELLNSYQM